MTNLLFSHYKNKYVAAYLYSLDFSYKALFHGILVGSFLDQYYKKVKSKVDAWLHIPRFLNFHTNKSNKIYKNRVTNFLTHVIKSYGTKGEVFIFALNLMI